MPVVTDTLRRFDDQAHVVSVVHLPDWMCPGNSGRIANCWEGYFQPIPVCRGNTGPRRFRRTRGRRDPDRNNIDPENAEWRRSIVGLLMVVPDGIIAAGNGISEGVTLRAIVPTFQSWDRKKRSR